MNFKVDRSLGVIFWGFEKLKLKVKNNEMKLIVMSNQNYLLLLNYF